MDGNFIHFYSNSKLQQLSHHALPVLYMYLYLYVCKLYLYVYLYVIDKIRAADLYGDLLWIYTIGNECGMSLA